MIYSFEKIQHDKAGQVKYHYVILDLEAKPLDPVQALTPADDAVEAGWFTLADLDRLNLPVSETTWTLLQKELSYD